MNPVQKLYCALAMVHTMLTRYRGFEAHVDASAVFANAPAIAALPMNSDAHARACWFAYRLNLLPMPDDTDVSARARTEWMNRNVSNAAWVADNARNLMYVQPDERAPLHSGLSYSIAFVVTGGTLSSHKRQQAIDSAKHVVESARAQRLPVTGLRIVYIVCGERPTVPVGVEHLVGDTNVSIETWYTEELQLNVPEHVDVPEHVAWPEFYRSLTSDERRTLPQATVRAATDPSYRPRLDDIAVTDPVARWHGFAPGQVICIKDRQLFEGGTSYRLRCVR